MVATTTRNTSVIPFPHQLECITAIKAVENTQNAALVLMAGGLGKTILSALYVKSRFDRFNEKRCLYLCHQNEILEQAEDDYQKVFGQEVTYGFFNGDQKINFGANIVFASFQTLRDKVDFYARDEFDIIVVDETHHAMAETYERTIRYYKPKFLLGMSMIGERLDGLDIREIYGKEVYTLPVVDALVRGLLCPIDYRLMSDEIGSLKQLQTERGRMNIRSLNRTVFVPKRDEEIVAIVHSHIQKMESPRGMIFCSSIEHAEMLSEMIPNSIPLHSGISKNERKVRLELFRNGTFKIALSVDMFNEGLDVPDINLIVFLRTTVSAAVYYSQLLRGSRLSLNKDKVIVLDFVANCERVMAVYELWAKVKIEREKLSIITDNKLREAFTASVGMVNGSGISSEVGIVSIQKTTEPFSLNVDQVEFKERLIPIIEILQKVREGFYATCDEASEAAIKLGIVSQTDYNLRYREDLKLVSAPSKYYENFPGWYKFLGNEKLAERYTTWQESSEAAIMLGISDSIQYFSDYKKDSKLPSAPWLYYQDFPGWYVFFGKEKRSEKYITWQEAAVVVIGLGIENWEEYKIRYKEDPKLPSSPHEFYKDFPGVNMFFDRAYKTCEEAGKAAITLGIKTGEEYKIRYKEDPKLVSSPDGYYKDFPGWYPFLGREKPAEKYETWQKASEAAIKLNIKGWEEYKIRYKEDPKLPIDPVRIYKDYPGLSIFLGLKYITWQEAGIAAVALGINIYSRYIERFKEDSKLPRHPEVYYTDFPGWNTFLNKK